MEKSSKWPIIGHENSILFEKYNAKHVMCNNSKLCSIGSSVSMYAQFIGCDHTKTWS